MLVVNKCHVATNIRLESRFTSRQAIVGIFEIRFVIFGKKADGVDQLTFEISAREHNPLNRPISGVLIHIFLQRADLLTPDRIWNDVCAGVK